MTSLATICSPGRQIEPSYFRKHAELENSNPDAPCRCPRRPDTTKKVVDRRGLESPGCFADCSMLVLLQISFVRGDVAVRVARPHHFITATARPADDHHSTTTRPPQRHHQTTAEQTRPTPPTQQQKAPPPEAAPTTAADHTATKTTAATTYTSFSARPKAKLEARAKSAPPARLVASSCLCPCLSPCLHSRHSLTPELGFVCVDRYRSS
jgi:hypothetical protein